MANKSHEAAVEEFRVALGLLIRRLRANAPNEQNELSWTQKAVLLRIEKDGPSTAAELARGENVKPQSMGVIIAQLEQRGMIERRPRPGDGRQIDIRLTPRAVAMRKRGNEASRSWLSETFAQLDKREQAILFEAGEIIQRMVRP